MTATLVPSFRSHTERIALAASHLAIPLEVSLELTHRCNFRCRHCYLPDRQTPLLDRQRLRDLLQELADLGTLFLTLTGGEVMLHDGWQEIVLSARELGFKVTLLCNGSLIDSAAAELLASLHVSVEVSLYGGRRVFEEITRTAGSFQQTLAGLEQLHRHGVQVFLKAPLLTLNRNEIDTIRDLAGQLQAECLPSTAVIPCRNGDCSNLRLRASGGGLAELLVASGLVPPPPRTRPPAAMAAWPPCAAGHRHACVTPAGDVLACSALPPVAGNICKQSFAAVWQGSAWLRSLRGLRAGDLPVCGTCHRLSYCGRCQAQALLEHGDLLAPAAAACERAAALEQVWARSD